MYLTVHERLIVELVAQRGTLTDVELAAELHVTSEQAQADLRSLEQAALVHGHCVDREQWRFTLTAAGTQAAAEGRPAAGVLGPSGC